MKRILLLAVITTLASCKSSEMPEGDTWKGILESSTKGEQRLEASFDFEQASGMVFLPDLIPVPLELSEVKQLQDSVYFTIGFRSGPGHCKGKLQGDTLKGTMKKDGMSDSPFWLALSGKKISLFDQPKPPTDEPVVISTKSNTPSEMAIKKKLEQLLTNYDLEPYLYTKTILVQDSVIPHSHPVLTISTRDTADELILSTFIHEQMHWYGLSKSEASEAAIAELKTLYPNVPTDLPEGGGSMQGTYLHLPVNYLEYCALQQLLGKEKALPIMQYLATHHYTWIYQTVLDDFSTIDGVMKKHGLVITP